jgi:hypothetical protein
LDRRAAALMIDCAEGHYKVNNQHFLAQNQEFIAF